MGLPSDHDERLGRARVALDGLSVGDAFGERFFVPRGMLERMLRGRELPEPPPWRWTDDTAMALSIVEVLEHEGRIDQDRLAAAFARRFVQQPFRGYGHMAHQILAAIDAGHPWQVVSRAAFGGTGSMGNGGGMRAAPIGAYFADDLAEVVENARASAEPTHAHPEGQAGAVAVAVAAAVAWRTRERPAEERRAAILEETFERTPSGETRAGLERARALPPAAPVAEAVDALGNGSAVISQDTVPFAVWSAARFVADYEEAMWFTVSGLGDRDTTCAMVGGIVAAGGAEVPARWIAAREPLHGRKT